MFRQQLLQLGGMYVLVVLKHQLYHIPVGAMVRNAWRDAEHLDLTEIELALLAQESTIEALTLLGAPLSPGATDARHFKRDRGAGVPANLYVGLHFAY